MKHARKLLLLGLAATATMVSAMELQPLAVGQPIPNAELKTAEGKAFDLRAAAKEQPVVIIFYRGGWCPYCNAHLGQLQDIDPQLRKLGYRIIAISPDLPKNLAASREKGGLSYTLLSDTSMTAAKAFGIAFEVDAPMLETLASYEIDIEAASGETHHLLPVPAVFMTGSDGNIKFAHANPDYKIRLAPEELLAAATAKPTRRRMNGFDLSNAVIPVNEIRSGGPPRDGIPSIDHPKFIAPGSVDYMQDADEVVSVTVGEETRAYPLRILVFHEIVNDEIAGQPIAVTYCPLCGTAMVFNRKVGERTLDFGVSGLLFQSDVLMYDRQTESLWSQMEMAAVAGPLVKTKFKWLPSQQLAWSAWLEKYPKGKVLSTETGFGRNYSGEAYARYKKSPKTMFPVPTHRTELAQKEWVFGLLVEGEARAYPVRSLSKKRTLSDGKIEIAYDPESQLVEAKNKATGKKLPVVKVYWFAWQAFYPDTELIQ